jgi:hypothetical protein
MVVVPFAGFGAALSKVEAKSPVSSSPVMVIVVDVE